MELERMKLEVQLAHVFKNQDIDLWYMSQKMDGMRALWDGGLTRGKVASTVPWANTEKDQREHLSTGLWSRGGKVIHAPDDWLDKLPPIVLDGELHHDSGFQTLLTLTRSFKKENWDAVDYYVFDHPCPSYLGLSPHEFNSYSDILSFLKGEDLGVAKVLEQVKLPYRKDAIIEEKMKAVLAKGGEGLMFRHPRHLWEPKRSHNLLKMKPSLDAEGVITGFTAGKGKFLGMIGAVILSFGNKRLELSGFTDEERQLSLPARVWALKQPGKDIPTHIAVGKHFSIGDIITFKYRELSDGGIPKEARYYRKN